MKDFSLDDSIKELRKIAFQCYDGNTGADAEGEAKQKEIYGEDWREVQLSLQSQTIDLWTMIIGIWFKEISEKDLGDQKINGLFDYMSKAFFEEFFDTPLGKKINGLDFF